MEHYLKMHSSRLGADLELTALKRCGEPLDVAKVSLFLVSDLSGHVIGEHILVTGGDIMSQ